MFGIEARCAHAGYAYLPGSDHGVLSAARHGLYPCRVTIYFMEAHLIFVAADGSLGELACLVGAHGVF